MKNKFGISKNVFALGLMNPQRWLLPILSGGEERLGQECKKKYTYRSRFNLVGNPHL